MRLHPLAVLIALALPAAVARAAAPTVDYLFPAGGQQGTTVTFTVGTAKADTKIDGWPARAVSDAPGLTFAADKENGSFTVTIAPDAPVGPHLVRVVNAEGSSAPRTFVVGPHAEQVEPKPSKDAGDTPYAISKPPAVANGRLAKNGESDLWAVDVTESGRWLVAELTCRRLGAPLDPLIQLLDPDGTVVAFNHDTFGLDPLLAYRVHRPGRYTIVVAAFAHPPAADVRFGGSKAGVYRLAVTTGPYARFAFPAVARRGERTPVKLFGWNLPGGDAGTPADVDARDPATAGADAAPVTGTPLDNDFRVRLSDLTGVPEAEPNGDPAAPATLKLPLAIDGRLDRPGDVDRFAVAARKGQRLATAVLARSVGSPADAVVTVTGPDGAEVARGDDEAADKPDPKIEWTAPADGTYVVAVSDVKRAGGPGHVYRLEVAERPPAFAGTVDAHAFAVAPGKSVDVKVTVARTGGYAGPLKVVAADLPPGVSAAPAEVPAKGGATTLTIKAAADAKPGGVPLRLTVVGEAEGKALERPVSFALEAGLVPAATAELWLTIAAPAKGK
ncbi:MAG TPA: PPC domain-containing protein [Humisphaera sp.]